MKEIVCNDSKVDTFRKCTTPAMLAIGYYALVMEINEMEIIWLDQAHINRK